MYTDILQYEPNIWKTADLLIASGIKQSDFPKFMMPFFALIMVESRFLRMADELRAELNVAENEIDPEDFISYVKDQDKGYNIYLFEHNKTLADICKNDKAFEIDFDGYLEGFDGETKDLLGIGKTNEEEKFMDISGISGQLKKKKILFSFVKAWSEIDLKPFNNSEITTLEEHIKRKWADISADTAGEQYTPDDVIALISDIVISKVDKSDRFLTIYDPTCGGGNMLFGVEDRVKESLNRLTATYGQDWSDSLYALAKIESRFRENSQIKYGNTLTGTEFYDKLFDVVVANPPFGIDWKGYKDDIEKDKTGRFVFLPSVSDGQLLFMQHIISKLDDNGIGVVVHNGSTLFSGDAGSGESNIRKWILTKDMVEAIIQLPTDEFFNTNIFTYLWILNKNKPTSRKKSVLLINAVEKYSLLKKNKGKKRKQIDPDMREDIIKVLSDYTNTENSKVCKREDFFYNKQAVQLTNVDYNGKSLEEILPEIEDKKTGKLKRKKSIQLTNLTLIEQITDDENITFDSFLITDFDNNLYNSLEDYNNCFISLMINKLDYKNKNFKVNCGNDIYYFDNDKETIIKENNSIIEELGYGRILIKNSFNKSKKNKEASISITVELIPDYTKDYEIIKYSEDEQLNKENIKKHLDKYITKPYKCLDNTVGVEFNFNKIFYKPEELMDINKLFIRITEIDTELKTLEKELQL